MFCVGDTTTILAYLRDPANFASQNLLAVLLVSIARGKPRAFE